MNSHTSPGTLVKCGVHRARADMATCFVPSGPVGTSCSVHSNAFSMVFSIAPNTQDPICSVPSLPWPKSFSGLPNSFCCSWVGERRARSTHSQHLRRVHQYLPLAGVHAVGVEDERPP